MLTYSQLAQVRSPNTNPIEVYGSGISEQVQLFIKIANVSSGAAQVRLFHDANGTTYDETTALVWDFDIGVGEVLEVDHIFFNNPVGRLAYRTNVANALVITVYGVIKT